MSVEAIPAILAEYDRQVRLNTTDDYDAIAAVIADDGDPVAYEVLDVAHEMGHGPAAENDSTFVDAVFDATEVYKDRLRAERLAALIAADIIAAAEQYPAVREAEDFGYLHTVYDANESILAALDLAQPLGLKVWDPEGGFDERTITVCNAATEILDEALRAAGFAGLEALAR